MCVASIINFTLKFETSNLTGLRFLTFLLENQSPHMMYFVMIHPSLPDNIYLMNVLHASCSVLTNISGIGYVCYDSMVLAVNRKSGLNCWGWYTKGSCRLQILVNGSQCFKSPLVLNSWGVTWNIANHSATFVSCNLAMHALSLFHNRRVYNKANKSISCKNQQGWFSIYLLHIPQLHM